ncbi:MAG: TrmH family RNA methyltransferase [Acidimicrobiales bacterium]
MRNYWGLSDPALRRRAEPSLGVFVIEGKLALQAALSSRYPLISVLVLKRRLGALRGLPMPAGVPVYAVGEEVMRQVTGFDVHRGVLALAQRRPEPALSGLLAGSRLVVVAEAVNDQENLGAIFRNSAAFGAGAVLLGPTCADPLYRRSVRVSLGHVLRVPFARLVPWPASLEVLEMHGYVLVALTPDVDALAVQQAAAELQASKVALAVGNEWAGLSQAVLARARPVRIPMASGVDSLNVAAATAVALHRFSGFGDLP